MHSTWYNSLDPVLADEWRTLWKQAHNQSYFNSPEWSMAYCEAFGSGKIHIFVLREAKKVVAIVPLMEDRVAGLGVLRFIGSEYAHRAGWVYSVPYKTIAKKILTSLAAVRVCLLDHLDQQERDISLGAFHCVPLSCSTAPTLVYPPRQQSFAVSKKNQILKKSRSITEQLQVKRYSNADLSSAMQTVIHIDQRSAKQQHGYNVFSQAETTAFYTKLIEKCPTSTYIHLLYRGNIPVAYEIGCLSGDAYVDCERAYLATQHSYTPGKFILVSVLEATPVLGVSRFDFGPGVDNFKRSLASQDRQFYTISVSASWLSSRHLQVFTAVKERLYAYVFSHKSLYALYKKVSSGAL